MSCKYCELKMRPIDDATKVLKGESWEDELGEGGYIGQAYDDKFRLHVYYDAGYAYTCVENIKYCPFCGAELTMPKEPLIEDEKICKILRNWAKLNNIGSVVILDAKSHIIVRSRMGISYDLEFNHDYIGAFKNIEFGEPYAIEELCGEDEE